MTTSIHRLRPWAAKRSLEDAGYRVELDEVLSIQLQDSKARLPFLTKSFAEGGINIDYIYAPMDEAHGGSRLSPKVSNNHLATQVLDSISAAA